MAASEPVGPMSPSSHTDDQLPVPVRHSVQPATLSWAPEVFRYQAEPAQAGVIPHQFDLTGRRRILSWGPYETLAAGRWQAVVRLSFDKRASGYLYAVEFGSLKQIDRFEFRPGKPGMFDVNMDIELDGKGRAEVRIILDQAAVGGFLGFYGAEIRQLTA